MVSSHWCDTFREQKRPKNPMLAFSSGSNRLVGRGARVHYRIGAKMGRILWQELDEIGDFGRFPVKSRSRAFSFCAYWPSARLLRGSLTRRTARRLGPRKVASGVIDCCGHAERHAVAKIRSHLAFPARDRRNVRHCGRIARNFATACCPR